MPNHNRPPLRFRAASLLVTGVIAVAVVALCYVGTPLGSDTAVWPAVVSLIGAALVPPAMLWIAIGARNRDVGDLDAEVRKDRK